VPASADAGTVEDDDGSGEDDRQPPPENPEAARKEAPPVRSLAEVRQLLKKGDSDAALAGLYRLRKKKNTPRENADIAYFIGNIYFDRTWWTDALKEYRFACSSDARMRSNPILIRNTVRTFGDQKTYPRARRLILDYVGRAALPTLRANARFGQGEVRRRASEVLAVVEKLPVRRAKR
jgi:hypothetical protein